MRRDVALVVGLLALLTGCASIVTGGKQPITIHSNVPGAVVSVNGSRVGATPYLGEIKRDKDTRVTVSKLGYNPQTFVLTTDLEPLVLGQHHPGWFFRQQHRRRHGLAEQVRAGQLRRRARPDGPSRPSRQPAGGPI